jgi:NitT/TauT family transport system ATP-binding protein
MNATPLIQTSGATKSYETDGGPVHALRSTDLDIEDGAFVSIVGPSGCGKTTLLKMIGGLIPASAGTIRVRGTPVVEPREDIGFVFQNAVLLPWKTARENVLLPLRVRGETRPERLARADELLELVGLRNFAQRYPGELSGGMQQRVSICRGLIQDPACLLMDEPFGALDSLTREKMNVFFNGLWLQTGKTVIMVTHSIQEAVFLSTRVIVMSDRPGMVVDDVRIPFPPQRSPEVMGTPGFAETTAHIRQYFTSAHID